MVILGVITSITKIQKRKINLLFIFICIFISVSISVSFLGVDFPKSFWGNYWRADGLITLFHLVGLFFLLFLFWNDTWQKPTFLAIALGSIGTSIWAISTYFAIHVLNFGWLDVWRGPIGVSFGQPNFLAGYLTITFPFLAYFAYAQKGKLRFLWIITILIQFAAIAATLSKGGALGIAAFVLGTLFIITNKTKWAILLILAIAFGGISYLLFLLAQPSTLGQLEHGKGFIFEGRPRIFVKALIASESRPLTGWGWANFDYAFQSVDWPVKIEKDAYVDKAHTTILEILVTTGVIGLVFYLLVVGYSFFKFYYLSKENDWYKFAFLSLLLIFIHQQTNITSIAEDVVFWLLLGVLASSNSQFVLKLAWDKMKTFGILTSIVLVLFSGFLGWWIGKNGKLFDRGQLLSPLVNFSEKKAKEKPFDKYSFENLSKREFVPSQITVEKTIKETRGFTSYLFSYQSDGKKVTGQLNIPAGAGPFPTILMLRGYIDPQLYKTGDGTKNAAAFFAKNGFITIAPDFLGYGGSDPVLGDVLEARFQTYPTALSLLASLKSIKEVDTQNLFIWGHSNGGHLSLAALEITGRPIPTTLWAPVSKYFPISVLFYTDDSEDKGKMLRRVISDFEENYDPNHYSIDTYFDRINAPIQLHQGAMDDLVPKRWSDQLAAALKKQNKDVTYYVYPKADHNMVPNWNIAVQRDLEFFKKNLK